MTADAGVDRHALHLFLWRKRNRRGVVVVNQRELAGNLGVNEYTMSRIMHELIDAGRIRRIGSGRRYVGQFAVNDPKMWGEPRSDT